MLRMKKYGKTSVPSIIHARRGKTLACTISSKEEEHDSTKIRKLLKQLARYDDVCFLWGMPAHINKEICKAVREPGKISVFTPQKGQPATGFRAWSDMPGFLILCCADATVLRMHSARCRHGLEQRRSLKTQTIGLLDMVVCFNMARYCGKRWHLVWGDRTSEWNFCKWTF